MTRMKTPVVEQPGYRNAKNSFRPPSRGITNGLSILSRQTNYPKPWLTAPPSSRCAEKSGFHHVIQNAFRCVQPAKRYGTGFDQTMIPKTPAKAVASSASAAKNKSEV